MSGRQLIGSDPSFTPAGFVAVFNQSLEMLYPSVAIVGELANFRVSKGAWVYFDLKDEAASVKFFGSVRQLPGPLQDGMQLEVYGRPHLHPRFGFSVQIDSVRLVGEGTIRRAQDLLFKKLEAEGLFAPERKRPLPYPPQRIGLVTSAESAAIHDFTKIIAARWPRLELALADSLVQGVNAPASIVSAVEKLNQQSDPPEVLVVIRGGGSADDLAVFSDESVVRAVAASRIPTMVAIGHENDVSLAELAADQRASTPSNAAELLVPSRTEELDQLIRQKSRMQDTWQNLYKSTKIELQNYSDELRKSLLQINSHALHQLQANKMLLHALDPAAPLARGYALVRDAAGKLIRTRVAAPKGTSLHITVADGDITARVE